MPRPTETTETARIVGRNLRLARRLAGMSPAHLCRLADVSRGQLSDWERGVHEPRPATRERLAEALEVEVWWLYRDHSLERVSPAEPELEVELDEAAA